MRLLHHLLGLESLKLLLAGVSDATQLPLGALVTDPRDSDLFWVCRPDFARRRYWNPVCLYLRRVVFGEVPGQFDQAPKGAADKLAWKHSPCATCDYMSARQLAEPETPLVGHYKCHLDLTELFMMVTVGHDRTNPIVAGQVLGPDADVLGALDRLFRGHNEFRGPDGRYEEAVRALAARPWGEAEPLVRATLEPGKHKDVVSFLDELALPSEKPVVQRRAADDIAELEARIRTISQSIGDIVRASFELESILHFLKGRLTAIGSSATLFRERWDLHLKDDDRMLRRAAASAAEVEELHHYRAQLEEAAGRTEEESHRAHAAILRFERARKTEGRRPLEPRKRWIGLRQALENAARLFRWTASERSIYLKHPRGKPAHVEVKADPLHLAEILDCLYDNAVKYSFSGRRHRRSIDTWWETGCRSAFGALCEGEEDDGEWLHIKIEDYGHQIRPNEAEDIFTPHYQGGYGNDPARDVPGAGLGLAIADEHSEAHGFRVQVWCSALDGTHHEVDAGVPAGRFVVALSVPPEAWRVRGAGAKGGQSK